MPLRPSQIGQYRKRWFSFRSKLGLHMRSPDYSHLESLPTLPLDHISRISPSLEEEPPTSISSLPVELLREIFLWSIDHSYQYFRRDSAPLNISHTCFLWRELAIKTSLLWNVITLDHFQYPAKMIQLWIERANGAPLFLDLRTMDTRGKVQSPNIRSAEILIQNAGQWEELEIGSAMRENPCFLQLEPQVLRNLKRCVWKFPSRLHVSPLILRNFEQLWTIACSAPLLRDVHLTVIPRNAPWSQLVTLGLWRTPSRAGIPALAQCSNLIFLEWELDRRELPVQLTQLTLPRLTHLSLMCQDVPILVPLFNALILPRLTRLDLVVWDLCSMTRNPIPSEVTKMLSHLKHPLEHFTLIESRHPETDVTITHILRSPCFHHLKRLSLPFVSHIPNLYTLLSSSANLPTLGTLDIGVERGQHPTALMRALQIRNSQSISGSHIHHVSLIEHCDWRKRLPETSPPMYLFKPGDLPNVEVYLKQYKRGSTYRDWIG